MSSLSAAVVKLVYREAPLTVGALAGRWLASLHSPPLHSRTIETYRTQVERHIVPALGECVASELDRARLQQFAEDLLRQEYACRSVRALLGTLHAIAAMGQHDGHLSSNPCVGIAKALRLTVPRDDKIKAMDATQLARFLSTVHTAYPPCYALFLTLARTGLRLGESLALRREDVDLEKRQLRVRASLDPRGQRGPTKTGGERFVDVSVQLASVLGPALAAPEAANEDEASQIASRNGAAPTSDYVFAIPRAHVQYVATRVCKLAGLPHFSPHCLRHTYASLMLVEGAPVQLVQRQLGHSNIGITCDLYGKWLHMRGLDWVDKLDGGGAQ